MQKYLLLILIFFIPCFAFSQSKILLKSSRYSETVKQGNETISYVTKPVFQQENAILTCDSAVFYIERNYFEAYNNVHINQADTVNIYSKRLNYDGNAKIAHLMDNVRLLDKESILTTNVLDYDMNLRIGQYFTGGKIVNKEVRIDSKNGYYFANTRDAYFKYNVIVVTSDKIITSDTLRYNTIRTMAYFYGPTNIKGKDDNLYTENGTYNTKTEDAYFGKNNLYTQGSKSMKGDSLYYYGKKGYGRAVKNIVFIDTNDKTLLRGQLGEYYKAEERAVVTLNAYMGMITSDSVMIDGVKHPDTLWMAADTLETKMEFQKLLKLIPKPYIVPLEEVGKPKPKPVPAAATDKQPAPPVVKEKGTEQKTEKPKQEVKVVVKPDSVKKTLKPPVDSLARSKLDTLKGTGSKIVAKGDTLKNPMDTLKTRILKAYHNVRVFKSNLQARADSLFYTSADSTLRWYKDPIVWSDGSQQTGDTIYAQFKDKKLNTVEINSNGFIVNVEADTAKFNQIKGKSIIGFFKESQLDLMVVDGNAESIYYGRDDKTKEYTDMSQSVSGRINAYFANKELKRIRTFLNSEGARTPVAELAGEQKKLKGFIWRPEDRPKSKIDVIGKPEVAPPKKVVKPAAKPPAKPVVKPKAKAPVKKQ